MTIIHVTRDSICEAIAKEPTTRLDAGEFVAIENPLELIKSRKCAVCAVGAALRSVINPNLTVYAVCLSAKKTMKLEDPKGKSSYSGDVPLHKLIKKKQYMHALSSLFERSFEEKGIIEMSGRRRARAVRQVKEECIAFVQANFPEQVALDIEE